MSTHREFCTLFDSRYLAKFVAMHRSLLAVRGDFTVTAFCFDEGAAELLERLALPNLRWVTLPELEAHDRELASVKVTRDPVEYCWTATPALPLYMFETRPELAEVTYIDADLMFFSDPEALFEEMGDASVLITPHRYPPAYRHHEINGLFNVQFLTFRNDERGDAALRWWHERCIEWCYNRLEDGKLGDQKYLDDWPERFEGVHVLRHPGGGLAPWNVIGHDVRADNGRVMVDDVPLVFFHYHRVRLQDDGSFAWRLPGFRIPRDRLRLVYEPYFRALERALAEIRRVEPGFSAGLVPPPSLGERLREARTTAVERLMLRVPAVAGLRRSR